MAPALQKAVFPRNECGTKRRSRCSSSIKARIVGCELILVAGWHWFIYKRGLKNGLEVAKFNRDNPYEDGAEGWMGTPQLQREVGHGFCREDDLCAHHTVTLKVPPEQW